MFFSEEKIKAILKIYWQDKIVGKCFFIWNFIKIAVSVYDIILLKTARFKKSLLEFFIIC